MLCSRILLKSYLPFLAQLKKTSLLAANKHRYRIIRKWMWGQGCFFHIYGGILDESLLPRKSALLTGPLPLCSLPSGYSRAEEFALPCGQPACCLVSVTRAQEETATCLQDERGALYWKGKPGEVSSPKCTALSPNWSTPMPEAASPEGSPGSPPGAEWRSPDEVGFGHRKNSNLSGCKLEQLLSGSDVKNHGWIGMANGECHPVPTWGHPLVCWAKAKQNTGVAAGDGCAGLWACVRVPLPSLSTKVFWTNFYGSISVGYMNASSEG